MKLPIIPLDKANHFIYGFTIFILFNLYFNSLISLGIVFLFALGKEIYDQIKYKGFDYKDIAYTIVPALVLYLKSII